jgi:hypothetical protein
MSVKKFIILGLALLLLFANIILVGCGGSNMNLKTTSVNFSELIESGNLNDITLTIYYMDFSIRTRIPLSLESLMGGRYNHRVVITGEDLVKHRDLLEQIINVELIPVENETFVNARLYYVFEHGEHEEMFSFLAFGGGDTMFVNGLEVEYNSIFFEAVLPFLPDDAVETIERYLDTMAQG